MGSLGLSRFWVGPDFRFVSIWSNWSNLGWSNLGWSQFRVGPIWDWSNLSNLGWSDLELVQLGLVSNGIWVRFQKRFGLRLKELEEFFFVSGPSRVTKALQFGTILRQVSLLMTSRMTLDSVIDMTHVR